MSQADTNPEVKHHHELIHWYYYHQCIKEPQWTPSPYGVSSQWFYLPHKQKVQLHTSSDLQVLAQIPCLSYNGGYTWLSETREGYKELLGDPNAAQPTMPIQPREIMEDSTIFQQRQYKKQLKIFHTGSKWRTAGIALLDEKFPGCLQLLQHTQQGGLPQKITLIDTTFNHVEATTNTEIKKREAYL